MTKALPCRCSFASWRPSSRVLVKLHLSLHILWLCPNKCPHGLIVALSDVVLLVDNNADSRLDRARLDVTGGPTSPGSIRDLIFGKLSFGREWEAAARFVGPAAALCGGRVDPAVAGCGSRGSAGGGTGVCLSVGKMVWVMAGGRFGFTAATEVLYICSTLCCFFRAAQFAIGQLLEAVFLP